MATSLLGEISEARSGTYNGRFRTYVRKFKIESDDGSDGAYAAGSTAGLPLVGEVHNEDPFAWCRDVKIDPYSNDRKYWVYTANYSSEFEMSINPVFDRARFTWTSEQFEKEISRDRDGAFILNSAGDPIRGVTVDDSRFQVRVEKNIYAIPGGITQLMDKLNNGPFFIDGYSAPKNWAKFSSLGFGPWDIRNGFNFRTMTFIIQFREDLWKAFPQNVGVRCKDSLDPNKRCLIINDGDLTPVTEPVPLDAFGNQLQNPHEYNVLYRETDRYEETSFSILAPYLI